jgi:hypothetical protein
VRRCSCHGNGAEHYSASRVGEHAEEWSKEESQGHAMDRICLIKKVIAYGNAYMFFVRRLIQSA